MACLRWAISAADDDRCRRSRRAFRCLSEQIAARGGLEWPANSNNSRDGWSEAAFASNRARVSVSYSLNSGSRANGGSSSVPTGARLRSCWRSKSRRCVHEMASSGQIAVASTLSTIVLNLERECFDRKTSTPNGAPQER
jgi:hypothetical protein